MDLCLFNACCRIPEVNYEQKSETANEVLPTKSGVISTRATATTHVKDIRGFDGAGGGM